MSIDTQPFDPRTIREQLRKITGRRDLITEDGGDNGIDFYINAGLRDLDRRLPVDFNLSRYLYQASSGEYVIHVPNCRAIKKVWMYSETDDERTELTKKSLSWLRDQYSEDWADLDTGTPLYYAPNVDRLAPDQVFQLAGNFSGYSDTSDINFGDFPEKFTQSGILFLPPTDGTYTFNVVGAFRSPNFASGVISFWTVMYPEAVILATQKALEVYLYRNAEGAKGFEEGLQDIALGIDYDAVEEEMAEVNRVDLYPARLARKPDTV